MSQCGTCGVEDSFTGHPGGDPNTELRPYGPGGSLICFRCAKATPEADARTKATFGALLEANEAVSPTRTTMLTGAGPVAIDGEQIDAEIANELARRKETCDDS